MPETSTAGIFQVAFIAKQMEQTSRAFFQTTFEPIGRVCAARHACGGLGLQEKRRTRACVPHTPYMRATACFIARQMEQTLRAFFQTTFEPVGSVCAARHARGGLGLRGKWGTRACVPHTPYMRATACYKMDKPISDNRKVGWVAKPNVFR